VRSIEHADALTPEAYGARAWRLARIRDLGIPIPPSVALSVQDVERIVAGETSVLDDALDLLGSDRLLALRPSTPRLEWGTVPTMLAIGMSDRMVRPFAHDLDRAAIARLYRDFVLSFASLVNGIESDDLESPGHADQTPQDALEQMLKHYEVSTGSSFPQSITRQLALVTRALFASWHDESARLLRQAHGAPPDAGIALVLQIMGMSAYRSSCSRDDSGAPRPIITQRRIVTAAGCRERPDPLPESSPHAATLASWHERLRRHDAENYHIDFTVQDSAVLLLEARPVARSVAEEIRFAVKLVEDGICTKAAALLRIEPDRLTSLLHASARPTGQETILTRGIDASPGAAVGHIAFTSAKAHALAAKGSKCILFRIETGPEDVRAMHVANGVVTGRGGMTSHAAVIARSLGVPCVAGAMDLAFDPDNRLLVIRDGIQLREGDIVTVDGTNGTIMNGAVPLIKPTTGNSFERYLAWADEYRDIDVRANADSRDEAVHAMDYGAAGIGLCRTEHMFYAHDRLNAMRKMIFTPAATRRAGILQDLLEMQRFDFSDLFQCLKGLPICIRLFDPPLHEFLPGDEDEVHELAAALDIPAAIILTRMEELREFNPMLGLRGVRLGIIAPEIYAMQAQAIFEAQVTALRDDVVVDPEIMIPLVSARREVEIIRSLVETVAEQIREQSGLPLTYKLGVMVETPRAALRAGDLATEAAFLSFGTNDLTQLTYGISRDDAARIIDEYIKAEVYPIDPFATLDREGVGELLTIASERSRHSNPAITLSICGEHSADSATIQYCRERGFSHVSCSPFNVPIARLAAAQCAIRQHTPQEPASSV